MTRIYIYKKKSLPPYGINETPDNTSQGARLFADSYDGIFKQLRDNYDENDILQLAVDLPQGEFEELSDTIEKLLKGKKFFKSITIEKA